LEHDIFPKAGTHPASGAGQAFRHHALAATFGKTFDLAVALVNTARSRPAERCLDPLRSGTLALPNRFPVGGKRKDAMNEKEHKARRKPAGAERAGDSKRRAREKALDQALEDTFPASDPVAAIEPAPSDD
jgi:hypothetical protein